MGPFTIAAGGLVSDASRLDAVVKKLADLAKNESALPADALKLNADKHKGVTFHTLSFEVPDDDNAEFIEQLIGEKSTLTVGIGKEERVPGPGQQGDRNLEEGDRQVGGCHRDDRQAL